MERGTTQAGQRVLGVAAELFYQRGINSVGVELIASTAGVTKKTLYDCFGSKPNLVVAYLERRDERWWTNLESRLQDTPPDERLLVALHSYLEHPDMDPRRGCAFLNAAAELPPDHPGLDVVRGHKTRVLRRLEALIREAHEANGDRARDMAERAFLVFEGAVAHRRIAGADLDDAAARTVKSIIESGSGPTVQRGAARTR